MSIADIALNIFACMELCAGTAQDIPLLPGLSVQGIARKRECNPRPAIDKNGLALTHQGSS